MTTRSEIADTCHRARNCLKGTSPRIPTCQIWATGSRVLGLWPMCGRAVEKMDNGWYRCIRCWKAYNREQIIKESVMRGSIKQRYKGTWSIILDLGKKVDKKTGKQKRNQKWVTVKGAKKEAQAKLAELQYQYNSGRLVEPSKITLGELMNEWLEAAIKPPRRRLRTYEDYKGDINKYLNPRLGAIPVQQLRAADIQNFYSSLSHLSASSLLHQQCILSKTLKMAQQQGLVHRNEASLVINKPKSGNPGENVQDNCWAAHHARQFLEVVKQESNQTAAFYALALDSGMRKGELCGLGWKNVDLENGKIIVAEALVKSGRNPVIDQTKTGRPRVIDIGPVTITLLRKHKSSQTELKLANRMTYSNYGLVFARAWNDMNNRCLLGQPLSLTSINVRQFDPLIKKAGLPRITFHGLRHTMATLLLGAGENPKVVQERLGHRRIETTMNVYVHVLPTMQQDAAVKMDAILHG